MRAVSIGRECLEVRHSNVSCAAWFGGLTNQHELTNPPLYGRDITSTSRIKRFWHDIEKMNRREQSKPRDKHLQGTTNRDIFGVCRGRCGSCRTCGRYQKDTDDYKVTADATVGQ
jgi:hypothetical protein